MRILTFKTIIRIFLLIAICSTSLAAAGDLPERGAAEDGSVVVSIIGGVSEDSLEAIRGEGLFVGRTDTGERRREQIILWDELEQSSRPKVDRSVMRNFTAK